MHWDLSEFSAESCEDTGDAGEAELGTERSGPHWTAALSLSLALLSGCVSQPKEKEQDRTEITVTTRPLDELTPSERWELRKVAEARGALFLVDRPDASKDRELALAMVSRDSFVFSRLDESLKNDDEFVQLALIGNARVFTELSDTQRSNQLYALTALRRNPRLLRECSEELQKTEFIVKFAFLRDASALEFAHESLRSDPDFILELAKQSSYRALAGASPELLADIDFGVRVVEECPTALCHIPVSLWKNPSFLRYVAQRSPGDLCHLPEEVQGDLEQLLPIASLAGNVFRYASSEVQQVDAFREACLLLDGSLVDQIPLEFFLANESRCVELVTKNNNIGVALMRRVSELPDSIREVTEKNLSAFRFLEISQPYRFDRTQEIIRNRFAVASPEIRMKLTDLMGEQYFAGIENDARPICIAVYAEEDWNGAFSHLSGRRDNVDALSTGYRVIYYDVQTAEQAVVSVEEAAVLDPAALLLLVAHSSATSMTWGRTDSDESVLSHDETELFTRIAAGCEKGGTVVLGGCSTGANPVHFPGTQNVAEALHTVAPWLTVIAPQEPTNFSIVTYPESNLLATPGFHTSRVLTLPAQLREKLQD